MTAFDAPRVGQLLSVRALQLLEGVRGPDRLVEAMAEFLALAEELGSGGPLPLACGAGCPHCCVLNVTVLLPEAAVIAIRLSQGMTLSEREELSSRLEYQRMRVRWMEDGERARRSVHCLFLDREGSCTIHDFRPLMCRGVTSLDRNLCLKALDASDPDGPYEVPADLLRKAAMDEAFCALARAMTECGLNCRSIELSAGVSAFVAEPQLCRALLAGDMLPPGLWE